MSLITPLYDSLWNEYLVWSLLVALFTFGWLYHHSFFYRSEDGENPNVDDGLLTSEIVLRTKISKTTLNSKFVVLSNLNAEKIINENFIKLH